MSTTPLPKQDSRVAVQCPECRRGLVVNRRGRCRCGAYLVGRPAGKPFGVESPDRTWLYIDGAWIHWNDRASPPVNRKIVNERMR